jgi:hypothetical protein
MLYCIGVSLSYAVVSVAITFVNKVVLSVYHFEFEQTIILLQLMVGSMAMLCLSEAGLCRIPTFDIKIAMKALPLAIWFFLYVATGLGSLRSLTVPTWSALRRLTALFILLLDAFLDGRYLTPIPAIYFFQLMVRTAARGEQIGAGAHLAVRPAHDRRGIPCCSRRHRR